MRISDWSSDVCSSDPTGVPPQPMASPGFGGTTGPQPVRATVNLANTKASGLGRPLPAGRVRAFDGGDFIGESQLGHTPEGQDIRLEVGTAFDLTAERERNSRSEEHTSELQSLMRISYAVFCFKKNTIKTTLKIISKYAV